ncbi:hypothetical protein DOU54_20930 [Agrobacterium sp. MS2]|nr:hypothetical protein DOU54_20930 [Agrobacterium sp. MS2]
MLREPAFALRSFQPSTGAVKKLSKNFGRTLAMFEQDVITPLTFGAQTTPTAKSGGSSRT